jgi:hypothetical protein
MATASPELARVATAMSKSSKGSTIQSGGNSMVSCCRRGGKSQNDERLEKIPGFFHAGEYADFLRLTGGFFIASVARSHPSRWYFLKS